MKYHREFSVLLLQRWLQSVDKNAHVHNLCNLCLFIYNAKKTRSPFCGLFCPLQRQQEITTITVFVR